ncbi:efflux RND transporter permease subunit [Rhodohalobacter sp.]|uniref:efflux RND transporter permease subunit n=1 Tax=Rhodohalobacter sp. TaxID=1974210 RepID=UPI00356976E5
MKRLISFFVRYPAMVTLGLVVIVLMGILSFSQTRYTLNPPEDPTEIYINITYRGASPLEIEERAISRIEENLNGISGMDRHTSVARENSGRITVEIFEWADIDRVLVDVENAVNRVTDLPEEMDRPIVFKQEMLNPTISLALTGDLSLQQKKDYADQIRDEFIIEKGISNVILQGFPAEEISVELNDEQMDRFGISSQEVAEAVRRNNIDITGGQLKTGDTNWQIRAENKERTAFEISQIPVRSGPNGERVLLRDIASVKDQFDDRPIERYLDGEESVVIQVLTTNNENLVAVAEEVMEYADDFNTLHNGVRLTVVEDFSEFVYDRVESLRSNAIFGLILVMLILTLFLDKRIAMWVSLTIPLAVLGTFASALMGYDFTINPVSIFGIILVLGMLVDTGVVVAENIYRHYNEFGETPVEAARNGAAEVASPMIISLMTTATAFSLFFFLPGKPGAFFTEVSFVVVSALLAALIVTFLFLPQKLTVSKVLSDKNKQTRFEKAMANGLTTFRDRYFIPFTDVVSHKWRWLNVSAFILLLIGSVLLIRSGVLPVTFFPYLDDDVQLVRIEMEPGVPVDSTKSRLTNIEEAVYKIGDQLSAERADNEKVIRNVEMILGPESHQGELRIVMMGGERRGIPAYEINNMFRDEVGTVPGTNYVRFISALGEHRFGGLPVDISVSGNKMEEIQAAAEKLKSELAKRDDLVDVADTDQRGNPELHIELSKAGEQLGLSLQDVMMQVRTAFFGMEVQTLQRTGDDVRVWLRFPVENRQSYSDLMNVKIRTPKGAYPLSEVAKIFPTDASLNINHINGRRTIRVDADLADPSLSAPAILGDISENIISGLEKEYPGVQFVIEGQNRESANVTEAMITVAPIILLIILALIVINFQSFSQTFLVLLTLPFAFTGVVIGHWIHGATMNIFSLIGMIALIGILINNLLVLVTAFNDNLKSDMDFEEALKDAVRSRFRPILLTTLSTVAGLIPMIFVGGLASAFLKPPAIAIAYGLTFGLFISLTLAPAFLVIFNNGKFKILDLIGKKPESRKSIEPAVILHEHHKKSAL